MRPFRFLANAGEIVSGPELAEKARRAEALGYSGLVVPDHLLEQLAPIPAMAAIAAATSTLRIGTFVLNNDLRHPAVLAQDLATLDVLSEGRLEIGIGGGWHEAEYRAMGLRFDPVGTRIERLGEAITVLKGLFGDEPFTFHGAHYAITEMDGHPKPVQRPHPPLMIGGGGRRVLSLAGREADIVSFAPRTGLGQRGDPRTVTVEATAEKIEWVRRAAGSRFDELELNIYPSIHPVTITDDARAEAARLVERVRERTGLEVDPEEMLTSPQIFVGSVDGLVEKFRETRRTLGISCFMLGDVDEMAPIVQRLAGT